jgi:PAS domain-containing protein
VIYSQNVANRVSEAYNFLIREVVGWRRERGRLMILHEAALLPLTHSWPIFERDQRFDLGCHFDWKHTEPISVLVDREALAKEGIGVWECDLHDNRLTWSAGVYDLFGIARGQEVAREACLPLYTESSRVAMERLRAYSIKHRRGFTIDVEIAPANGGRRWIRLTAAPVCVHNRVTCLQGIKRDITREYS